MKILTPSIGSALSSLVSSTTSDHDQPRSCQALEEDSPPIMWAVEMPSGMKLVIVDEHPRRLIEVHSFMERKETLGNVAIARRLVELGILREEVTEARRILPGEFREELPSTSGVQLPLFETLREAG